jgi:hypothetical protein
MTVFETIAALKSSTSFPQAVALLGHSAPGDGGGGDFYWDANSVEKDNNGTVIKPASIAEADAGRWKRLISDAISVKWFGAKGNNAADDTVAINACADFCRVGTKKKMLFPDGTYITDKIDITGIYSVEGINPTVTLKGKPGKDILYWKAGFEPGFRRILPWSSYITNLNLELDGTVDVRTSYTRIGLGGERIGNTAIHLPGDINHYLDKVSVNGSGAGTCGIFFTGPAYKVNLGTRVEIRNVDYGFVVGMSELFTPPAGKRVTVTANGTTDTFTSVGAHSFAANAEVIPLINAANGSITGITSGVKYYVKNPTTNSFQLAATTSGTVINFTVTGQPDITIIPAADHGYIPRSVTEVNASVFTSTNHGYLNGHQVALIFDQNDGNVVGIEPRKRYYIVNATTDTFQLASADGGAAVTVTITGTPDIYVMPAGGDFIEYACDEWASQQLITGRCLKVGVSIPNLVRAVFNSFDCQSNRVAVRLLGYSSLIRYSCGEITLEEIYTEGPFDTTYMNGKEYARIEGNLIFVGDGPPVRGGDNVYITLDTTQSIFNWLGVDGANKINITGDSNMLRISGSESNVSDTGANNTVLFMKDVVGSGIERFTSYISRYSLSQNQGGFWPDYILKGSITAPYQADNVLFYPAISQRYANPPAMQLQFDDPTLEVNGYVRTNAGGPAGTYIREPLGSGRNQFVINRFFPRSRWMLFAKVRSKTGTTQNLTVAFQRLGGSGFAASKVTSVGDGWQIIGVEVNHSSAPNDMVGQIYVQSATTDFDLAYFVVVPFAGETFSLKTNFGGGIVDMTGNGSPEGIVTAAPGSTYRNASGGVGTTLYVKESAANVNTGWKAL